MVTRVRGGRYNMEYGRVMNTLEAHDDAVAHLVRTSDGLLITASWDATVKVRIAVLAKKSGIRWMLPDACPARSHVPRSKMLYSTACRL